MVQFQNKLHSDRIECIYYTSTQNDNIQPINTNSIDNRTEPKKIKITEFTWANQKCIKPVKTIHIGAVRSEWFITECTVKLLRGRKRKMTNFSCFFVLSFLNIYVENWNTMVEEFQKIWILYFLNFQGNALLNMNKI